MWDLSIEWVVISPPVTTVKWSDGTTTVVRLTKEDTFNESEGILLAIAKKFLSYSEIQTAIKMGRDSFNDTRKV